MGDKIKELIQDIYCTIDHGECFYEQNMLEGLIKDVKELLVKLENYELED